MKVKSMKKAVAMACALGMLVTSGAVPGSILTAEASTSWTWSANTSESGYSKVPTSELTATADSCAGASETDSNRQANGSWNNAVDGNVNTYWHSRYDNSAGSQGTAATGNKSNITGNNTFTVTLANAGAVQGVTYLSRQSQLGNGYFHKFKVEVQKDGENSWTTITGYDKVEDGSADSAGLITLTEVNSNNFASHKFEKEFVFSEMQKNVKKIRFTVTADNGGSNDAFLNAAEISVLKPNYRSSLDTAIAEAEAEVAKTNVYTADSLAVLSAKLNAAKEVKENTAATDEALSEALTALTEAKAGLVRYTVSSVTVTSVTGVTTVGKLDSTLQLNATVETENEGADKTVTWTSSDTDVATVSDTGLVTFKKKNGSTTITATSTLDTEKSAMITLNLAAKVAEQESSIVEDGTAAATGDSGTLNTDITWSANWAIWSGERDATTGLNKYHGNSKVDANANGAYFEYTFTGTGIAYYAQMHSNQGTMNVKIGPADASVNEMTDLGEFSFDDGSAHGTPQKEVFSKRGLEQGTYKVRFTRTSADKGINFDFLKVYSLADDTTITVDKAELQNQLAKKAELTEADYTSEKWAAYCAAYNAAVEVMNNAAATEEDVAAQVAALTKAYTVLTTNVDKAALNAAIAEATGLVSQTGTYTSASLAELQKALDAAKTLAADDTAEQDAVDAAVAALESAKAGLVQIKVTDMTVTAPTKVVYERGDNFDTTGMVVTVTDNNGQTRELTATEYTVEGFDSATAGEKTVTVKYGELEKSFTVTVNACYIVTVDGKVYTNGQYNDLVTVTAEEKSGQTFAGWKDASGKGVSTDAEYSFRISGDVTLTSVYDEEVKVEAQAKMNNAFVVSKNTNGSGNARFVGQIVVPEGYRIQECGVIWTGKNTTNMPNLYTSEGDTFTAIGKKIAAKSYTCKYQFSVTVNNVPAGKTARGVVYAKLTNGTDTVCVFSDESSVTVK